MGINGMDAKLYDTAGYISQPLEITWPILRATRNKSV
jgi:hypothetical protein